MDTHHTHSALNVEIVKNFSLAAAGNIICMCLSEQCIEGESTWRDLMKTALENLIVVLKDENTISPYEMCSSGLVQALFTVLNNVSFPFKNIKIKMLVMS